MTFLDQVLSGPLVGAREHLLATIGEPARSLVHDGFQARRFSAVAEVGYLPAGRLEEGN